MRRQAGGRKTVCMNSSKSTMESWTTDVMNLINGTHVVRFCLFAFSLVLPLLTCRLIYSVVVSIPISFKIVFLIVCEPFITRSMYTFLDPFSTTRRSFYRASNTGVAVIMPSCFVFQVLGPISPCRYQEMQLDFPGEVKCCEMWIFVRY